MVVVVVAVVDDAVGAGVDPSVAPLVVDAICDVDFCSTSFPWNFATIDPRSGSLMPSHLSLILTHLVQSC